MVKKKALGRGLSNLIPMSATSDKIKEVTGRNDFKDLELIRVHPDPNQPRKHFDEVELGKLASTLKTIGIIEPIVVRPISNGHMIISGERRWRAAKLAGFKKIPSIIKQVNDAQALIMGIVENIQREELNPVEEARAYQQWMSISGLKASDISKQVGKDRSTVTNLIRLLKLPDEILKMIESKNLKPGQARPLISIGDKNVLIRLVRKIVTENWTARKVEEEVARIQGVPTNSSTAKKTAKDTNIRNLEDKIRRKLMTKVSISHKATGAGSLTIQYANLDDMDRLLQLLKLD